MSFLSYILVVLAGAANPAQAGANGQLNRGLASPIWSALFVYGSGVLGVLFLQLFVRQAWPALRLANANVPWWAWVGGILSIVSTMVGLTLAQKMGSAVFTGLSLTASVLTSIALDHFGLLGFKQHSASLMRMVGAGLMVAGIWLIAQF